MKCVVLNLITKGTYDEWEDAILHGVHFIRELN